METAEVTTQACEQLDPRIRRTRQLLFDALKRLLHEKEFDKISIQDITEAATLNRATFYAHYPDKFALLEQLIRVSFLELLAQRKVRYDGTCSLAFQAIILAVCDYLADLQSTAQKSLSSPQHQFEPFVEATVIDQLRQILLQGAREHSPQPAADHAPNHPPKQDPNQPPDHVKVGQTIPKEMIAATASWAIYGAAKQWANTPNRVPAEDFVAIAVNLVQPIILAGAPNPIPHAVILNAARNLSSPL
jgi:AcrR family transcriptional regulator